jgi:hypothetical protein
MPRTRLIDKKSLSEEAKRDMGYAARQDVEDFAANLSLGFLQCRELGHVWKPWAARRDDEHNTFERSLRCPRCKTKRHETLSVRGAKLRSYYEYPEGYTTDGLGRIVGEGRDALRVESMIRSLTAVQSKEVKAS